MIIKDIESLSDFRTDQYKAVALGGGGNCKAMLVCLEAGQFIPVHKPGIDLCLLIIDGEGILSDGQTEQKAGPGDFLYSAAGESRGVMAKTRMLALAVVSPPPVPKDHETVQRMLKEGRWRDADTDHIIGRT